jgi:hypothetical protein
MADEQPYPEKFEQPDHIPQAYLAAIGQVVVNWCVLESATDLTLAKLSAFELDDPRGVIVTAHLSWPQKTDTLEALVDVLKDEHPHLITGFTELKPILTEAQKGRNRIVHGQWGIEKDGTVHKLRATARGKLKFGIEPITLDEITTISHNIGSAGFAMLKMVVNK